MRKDAKIIFIPIFLVFAFVGLVRLWENFLSQIPRINEYILAFIFLIIQTKLLSNIKESFLGSDSAVISLKRQIYCFYLDNKDSFSDMYKKVCKNNALCSASFILALLKKNGHMDDESFDMCKPWLDKTQKIPYKTAFSTVSKADQRRISERINAYDNMKSSYDDFFFGCLSADIIRPSGKQSIIELALIWLSYFFLLTDVFQFNLSEYSGTLMTVAIMTITDAGLHYKNYCRERDSKIKMLRVFLEQMEQMRRRMDDPESITVTLHGETFPLVDNFYFLMDIY